MNTHIILLAFLKYIQSLATRTEQYQLHKKGPNPWNVVSQSLVAIIRHCTNNRFLVCHLALSTGGSRGVSGWLVRSSYRVEIICQLLAKQKYCFYNKSQQYALFLKFILVNNSTCFRQTYCPSSGVLILYSQQLVFVIVVMLTGWSKQQTVNLYDKYLLL